MVHGGESGSRPPGRMVGDTLSCADRGACGVRSYACEAIRAPEANSSTDGSEPLAIFELRNGS